MASGPPTSPLLLVDAHRVGPRVLVTASGEVDISNADELRRGLETARAADVSEIWVDLTRITFIDCRGLHVLRDQAVGLRADNRRLVLICPLGPVRRLLVLTGADREFEIHSTAAAARRPWRTRTF